MEEGETHTKNPREEGKQLSEFAQEATTPASPEIPPTPLPPHLAEAFTIAEKPVPTGADLKKIYDTMNDAGCVQTPLGEIPFGVVADNPGKYGFMVERGTIEGGGEPSVVPEEVSAPMRVAQEGEEMIIEEHPLESIEDPEMRALQDKVTEAQRALRHEEELPWTVQDNQYRIPYARIVLERARQNLDRYCLEQELAHTEEREDVIRGFLAEQARRRMVDDLETQILWNKRGVEAYMERVARTERGMLKLRNELDSLPTGARDRMYLEDEMERLEGEYKNLQAQREEYDALEHACASRIEEVRDVLARDRSQFDVPRAMEEDPDFKACLREVAFSGSDDEALRKVVSGEDPRKKAEALFRKRFPQKDDYYASQSEPVDTEQVARGVREVAQVPSPPNEPLKTMTPEDVEAVNPALFSDKNTPTREQLYTVAPQQKNEAMSGDTVTEEGVSFDGVEETEHVGNGESAEHMKNVERSGEGSDSESSPFEEPSERYDKEDDPYPPRASLGERLIEYLTGLTLEHPEAVLSRLESDQSAIRAKYGLPARAMRFDNPPEYERVLYKKATEYGVSIRPADEFGDFFTAHSYAQGVTDEASNRIGAGFGISSRDDYERKLGVLEHEIIHAGQALHSPGMPIEVREYEAYVAGSSFDHLHGLEANELRESLEVFFSVLVGGSVMHEYLERGADPVWNTPTFFESAGNNEKNP